MKRGVVGTFHKVSAKYMPLYVAEFQFRYNNRENTDIFGAAIARAETSIPGAAETFSETEIPNSHG